MSKHENAQSVLSIEDLAEERKVAEAEKERLAKETSELNDRLISQETKQEEKGVLKAKIIELKGQNKLIKQRLTSIEERIFELQGQENGGQNEERKTKAKAVKPKKEKVATLPIEPVDPTPLIVEETGTPKQTPKPFKKEPSSRTSGDLEYSTNLDDVLLVLKTKRGLRAGKRAETVTNSEIKPTEEIKNIIKKAGNKKLNPEEKQKILSILKSFPNNDESNTVHDAVLRILKNDGALVESDFQKQPSPKKTKVESGEDAKIIKLQERIQEAKHQLQNIEKRIIKLKGNIEKPKTVDDYYALVIAEARNNDELKKERQAETEKLNQIESLENELRKIRTLEEPVPVIEEAPKVEPEEEEEEVVAEKIPSTLTIKLEGDIVAIDAKITNLEKRVQNNQEIIEHHNKEIESLKKDQLKEGTLGTKNIDHKIKLFKDTSKLLEKINEEINTEINALKAEKENTQKEILESEKGPRKTTLEEFKNLKIEAENREKIKKAENFDQLIATLASIENIPSASRGSFSGEEMIAVIKDLRSENPSMTLNFVTRGYELRDKVEELLKKEHPGNIEKSELNDIERRLNEARENYSREYVAYVQSQKKPSLLNKVLSALGKAKKTEETKPSEAYIEAKRKYDEVLAEMGQHLFNAKKEQLKKVAVGGEKLDADETNLLLEKFKEEEGHTKEYQEKRIADINAGNLTEAEKDLLLRKYKMGNIFQKVVLDEHELLTQKSIELQPTSEKNAVRKLFDKAVKKFSSLPPMVKWLAGWGTIVGVGALTSGVSLPVLAGANAFRMASSILAAKGVGWMADNISFLKDGSGKRYEKAMQNIREAFANDDKNVAQSLEETGGAKNKQADEASKYRLAKTLWMAAGGAWAGVGARSLSSTPEMVHRSPTTPETPSDQPMPQGGPLHYSTTHHAGIVHQPVHHSPVHHAVSHHQETMPAWKHNALGLDRANDPVGQSIDNTLEKYPDYQNLNPTQRIFVTHSIYHDVMQQSHHHAREIIVTPEQFHHHINNASHFHDPSRMQQIMGEQRRLEMFRLRNIHHLPRNNCQNLVFKLQNQAFHHHK